MKLWNFFVVAMLYTIGNVIVLSSAQVCGCKKLRDCYDKMLSALLQPDEETCIENASIGSNVVTIFLKALSQFCGNVIKVTSDYTTNDARNLYEVTIFESKTDDQNSTSKPVLIIDAGQLSGKEPVQFALYIIEQLVACQDNDDLIQNVKWVILPCTNPDGLEYSMSAIPTWKKNVRQADDSLFYGVDISRNFNMQWSTCSDSDSMSPTYKGPFPASENETVFIQNVLTKYKDNALIYLSIRRDGHSIAYPYGYTDSKPNSIDKLVRVAGEVTAKVNQKAGGIYSFSNNSIYDLEGSPYCGNSVDYATNLGIPLAFEMRVFLQNERQIMSQFHPMPWGYDNSLRSGYFSGIRELYNVLTNEKKYGDIFQ